MNEDNYQNLSEQSLAGEKLTEQQCLAILSSDDIELLPLLQAAYHVRKVCFGLDVMIHVINNAQNGFCPEDCQYCAQAKTSQSAIEQYSLKSDEEILAEARRAYERGAYRYCMVFAGRGPSQKRVEQLAALIRLIKTNYPLEVCVSAGLLDQPKAQILKEAGLDRLNHNLNTSDRHYSKICSTHTYEDRMETLRAAQSAGLSLCSGIIVGMGEDSADVVSVAKTLRDQRVASIPVNFYIPIEGNSLQEFSRLTPEYCLRVLCLFRLLNPKAEIRIAAGREIHLRDMEVMSLYPANSLFLEGYLNTQGSASKKTLQMIKDAGFNIKSDCNLDDLIGKSGDSPPEISYNKSMKTIAELRPELSKLAKK